MESACICSRVVVCGTRCAACSSQHIPAAKIPTWMQICVSQHFLLVPLLCLFHLHIGLLFPWCACNFIGSASFLMVVCWPWMLHPAAIFFANEGADADFGDPSFCFGYCTCRSGGSFCGLLALHTRVAEFCPRGMQRAWASTLLRQHLQDGCKFCKSMSLTFFAAE